VYDDSHGVRLVDIVEVRAGVDLDPHTSITALRSAAARGEQDAAAMLRRREAVGDVGAMKEVPHHKSFTGSLFASAEPNELLYGTVTLRAGAKPEEFTSCLSLITTERYVHASSHFLSQ
jgi:hypothetical protein